MRKTFNNCFVLKKQDYRESDLLLTIFSLNDGLFRAFAGGVRKANNKWRNAFLPFSEIDIECLTPKSGNGLYKIIQAESRQSFFTENSIMRMGLFAYCAELCACFCPEQQEMNRVYQLLCEAFAVLEQEEKVNNFHLIFTVKFFSALGYFPDFSCCGVCSAKFNGQNKILWQEQLVCDACQHITYNNLDFNDLKVLSFFQKNPIGLGLRVALENRDLIRLFDLTQKEFSRYSTKPLKSLRVLAEI